MHSDAEKALVDVSCEFARSYGGEITEEIREKILIFYDKTVRKGIDDFGVVWEEPVRSFVLKHVGKIGRKFAIAEDPRVQTQGPTLTLDDIAEDVIAKAKDACTIRAARQPAMELGPLC